MAGSVGERTALSPTTRAALIWGGLAALVIVLFIVAVVILNATVYSAKGFVHSYVDALNRGDTSSALALAGVQATGASGDELLTVPEKGELRRIQITAERESAGGVHRVTVSFDTSSDLGDTSTPHTTTFAVRPAGKIGGLFSQWQFQTAPTASIDVTPLHDPRFTANGSDVTTLGADVASRFTVLAPAVYSLAHDTMYLTATPETTVADTVGGVVPATVDVQPRASFVAKVRADVDKYLRTDCLPQRVLLPSGCPFGQEVDDRLTSTPTWSMTTYPPVSLDPTDTAGVWKVVTATGEAHLRVGAESLYDGHDYTINEDVPFTVGYQVLIGSNNGLTITPQ
ncbi:hypothetical protein [Frondihabitans sp. PAMC 28766]|uniref:hypothetical protein n=1 Tax=Frondihabitans sp. PAMC 28766 TaxID=1795630 RepID=UPI0012FF77E4|nr:hypothetical protein [Frondihabitans sp. PAMC 28766]